MAAASASRPDPAWVDKTLHISGAAQGPLAGLTFAAKDAFDIEGHRTGFGNPDWLATHTPATGTAPPVQSLLEAGASLCGKAAMDELAYSINGENAHYGTPANPAAPGRIPGGSSSGSAVVVARGDVDFALGTDTGGSIRIPASYCGILGFRPTHGRISLEHCAPLARSFDTCGWFTRDVKTLRDVGRVLLAAGRGADSAAQPVKWRHMLLGRDAFAITDEPCSAALNEAMHTAALPFMFDSSKDVIITEGLGHGTLTDWWNTFRILQAAEVWEAHGEWVARVEPNLGPGIRQRFEMASKITAEEVATANGVRADIRRHMDRLLGDDTVLIVPSAAGVALLLNTPEAQLDAYRRRVLSIICVAGLAGLPQVSLPVAQVEGCPLGLGIIGPRGSDEALLDLAVDVMRKFAK